MNDIEQLLRTRLDPVGAIAAHARGDRDLNPDWPTPAGVVMREAAVLAPIVMRESGWTLLFTQRAHETPAHPGQISFPGGRVEEGDADAVATALRETEEEIGLARSYIEPVGAFDRYETGTGYRITPIVGLVTPGFSLTLEPREVAEVFEVPLAFLFDPANHERRAGEWRGRRGHYWVMQYENRFIWGATAGMVRALYERLYD